MIEKVLNIIDKNRDYVLNLLCKLIEIPTVVPPGQNYEDMCNFLKDVLKDMGLRVNIIKVPKEVVEKYFPEHADYPRLIVHAEYGSGKPTLHFNGHYDVVPPGTGWTVTEPFKPKYIDGKVYGRGTSDMKSGIASTLLTIKALVESDFKINGKIEVSFVPDEEVGGQTGTAYLLENIPKPDYAIIAEPTGLNDIWIGNKGLLWLSIEVLGKQVHASKPWLGINAFEKGVELAYLIIKELKPRVESRLSSYEYEEIEGKRATMVLGGEVKGGDKVNIVPGYFNFSIDRRILPEEDVELVEKEMIQFIHDKAKELNININIKILQKSKASIIDSNAKIVMLLKECIMEELNIEPRTTVCIGGLDTRYFQERGIEALTYGPGNPDTPHIADEYVDFENIIKVSRVYARLVNKLLG